MNMETKIFQKFKRFFLKRSEITLKVDETMRKTANLEAGAMQKLSNLVEPKK